MDNNVWNTLRCLVRSLKTSEIKLVENFYKLRISNHKACGSRLKLFKLILQTKPFTDLEIMRLVDASATERTFTEIQKGLQQDVMDILMLFEGHANPEVVSEMECRKQYMQGKLMINRGLVNEGVSSLKTVLTRSEQLELYDVSLSIYGILSAYERESSLKATPDDLSIKAHDYAVSVLHAVKANPESYSTDELAGLHLEIASMFLKQENYSEAIQYGESAISYAQNRLHARHAALRILFLAYFHIGDIDRATQIEQEVSSSPHMYSNSKLIAIWSLNRAALLYAKGRYWESVEIIKSNYPFIRKNPFWVAGYRFLEVLNVIELRDYEWVEFKLDVMRKFIVKNPTAVPVRMKMCYKILRKYLDSRRYPELQLPSIDYFKFKPGWDPLSCEIINVEEWYKLKSVYNI